MRRPALLLLAMTAALFATSAPRAQIVPAQFVQGVLTQIDRTAGTFVVGPDTYSVRPSALTRFQTGEVADVTFVVEGGRREVISMQRTDRHPPNCIITPLCFGPVE